MRKLFIALLSVFCLASCSNKNTFKINVNLENSNGKTVCLKHYVDDNIKTLNSIIAKNNTAIFNVEKGDNIDAYFIDIDGWKRPLIVFTENQDVTITGDYNNYSKIAIKSGLKQDEYNSFVENFNNIEDEAEAMYSAMSMVKENHENLIGAYVLYRYKWAFSLEDLIKLVDSMEGNGAANAFIKNLKPYIEGLENVSVGRPYINFKESKPNGELFILSDYIGRSKLLMIDFWASWCPDCRKENPNVVATYNAFKNKGFDIVSVSLDTNKEAWLKAIADDNLTWDNHVCDFKGWENKIASLYSVAFIPQNVLIDKNGIIVARNLSGDELMSFVKNYLSAK